MIKEHTTIQSRAACDLWAERRVCLTGTPLQNSLNDLFSLVCFLRLEPFTDRTSWTTHIGTPAKMGDKLGISRLKLLMRQIALRRTKQSVDKHGKPILSLPPKKDSIVYLELGETEKKFYSTYHQRSRKTFLTHTKDGTVLKNYCSILQELLRLRQICAHMGLVLDSDSSGTQPGGQLDLMHAVEMEGLTKSNAIRILALMRDTGVAQCGECGQELSQPSNAEGVDDFEDCTPVASTSSKRGRKASTKNGKKKTKTTTQSAVDEGGEPKSVIITRCQHLFCLACFRHEMCPSWPEFSVSQNPIECSVCVQIISAKKDVMEISNADFDQEIGNEMSRSTAHASITPLIDSGSIKQDTLEYDPSKVYTEEEDAWAEFFNSGLSTKLRHLISDLWPFSQANPASVNYAPNAPIFQVDDKTDSKYKAVKGTVVKSVVFSQWTKLLDKCVTSPCPLSTDFFLSDCTDHNRHMQDRGYTRRVRHSLRST